MKKTLLPILLFTILQSCVSVHHLPKNLPTSLLLVEKNEENMESIEGKGFVNNLGNAMIRRTNRRNAKINAVLERRLHNYPYAYKLLSKAEIGDNISASQQTYLLKNGSTSETINHTSNGTHYTSNTEVLLVDLNTKSKENTTEVSYVKEGIVNMIKKFSKKAKKLK